MLQIRWTIGQPIKKKDRKRRAAAFDPIANRLKAHRDFDLDAKEIVTTQSTSERQPLKEQPINKPSPTTDEILAELSALRIQGDQTAKWLTTVAEQVSVVKDQIAEVNNKQVAFNAETVKECSELKRHWDTQSQTIVSR